MRRIATERATVGGLYQPGDPGSGLLPTALSAQALNNLQEAIATVIEAAGLTLPTGADPDDYTLLQQAIENMLSSQREMAPNTIRSNLTEDIAPGVDNTLEDIVTALGYGTTISGGWIVRTFPDGLIEMWGRGATVSTGTEATQTINFPVSFPTACLECIVSTEISSDSIHADLAYQRVGEPSQTSVTVQRQVMSGNDDRSATPLIHAIGH